MVKLGMLFLFFYLFYCLFVKYAHYSLLIDSKIDEAIEKSATFTPASYPPHPPAGSKKRGLEQITQDVVKGTWNGNGDSKAIIPKVTGINANQLV